jgi:hypothetical protein
LSTPFQLVNLHIWRLVMPLSLSLSSPSSLM